MWRWIVIVGVEIAIFGGTALIKPDVYNDYLWLMVLGGVFLVFLGITFDHWPKILQFKQNYYWADVEVAARMFRDEVEARGLSNVGEFIDFLAKERASGNPLSTAMLGWLKDGADRGQIQITGILKNGSVRRKVPVPLIDTLLSQAFGEMLEDEVVGADGNVYSDIRFNKTGIRSYVLFLMK